MSEDQPQSRAPDAITRTSGDRADEVIGRALTESADLRTVLEAVEAKGVYYTLQNGRRCYFCEAETGMYTGEPPHLVGCPVTLARRLLGKE